MNKHKKFRKYGHWNTLTNKSVRIPANTVLPISMLIFWLKSS